MSKKKLVVLTGAGISAESGISTFRDSNGLWENHDVMEVASPQGWRKNRALVLDFYNKRRAQLGEVEPNAAHTGLKDLETDFDVHIITQNVDDLHERGGSSQILHLHGQLTKVRSSVDENLVYEIDYKPIAEGDKCDKGSQLRPHIVWFGEAVPAMETAIAIVEQADFFAVVGTSMAVYPAASLIQYCPPNIPKFVVDPNQPEISLHGIDFIQEKATVGIEILKKKLNSIE